MAILDDYGMTTPDGDAAVRQLVSSTIAEADVDDFEKVVERLNEGVALIASLHPEVYHPAVIVAINEQVSQGIADRIIATSD